MSYIPALRFNWLTRFYDPLIRATLKEDRFRGLLLEQAAVQPTYKVLDVGCGTGTLALMIKQRVPSAEVFGVDGDPGVLKIAEEKFRVAGVSVNVYQGRASEAPFQAQFFDRVVSTLVFHHLSTDEKLKTLQQVKKWLKPQGELHIADWGKAQNPLMRAAFLPVQMLDGFKTTSDNVKGKLPELMRAAGFVEVIETHHEMTVFGTLSLYRGTNAPLS
ncbi:MAG: class I SAM-dependent methyltransferase [Myxococcales bacterium]|nr:class I SAM-dependent methyltransferase [Myxococcales bacterium]